MLPKRLPTFSGIDRAMACRASCVLPQVDHVSALAEGGQAMHAFLQAVNEKGREAALTEAPDDERAFLESIPVEDLPTDGKAFAAEVALAFDAATGTAREIGRGLDRQYGDLKPTEFAGTLDVASLMDADGVFYPDWKRGGWLVKPARENWQIRVGLVAASRAWGRSRGRGELVRIFEDGRDPFRSRCDFTKAELDQAAVELTTLAVRILRDRKAHARGETIPATTGEHCRYCPAFQFCPANLTLARAVATDAQALQNEILVSRDTAPQLVEAVRQLKAVTKAIEEALDTLASQEAAAGNPLEIRPGTYYAPVPRPREAIDGAKAKAVIEAELGEYAKDAISYDVTKAALRRAVTKQLAARGVSRGITKAEEELLLKLRVAGAVKRTVSYSCDITTKVAVLPKQATLPVPEAA